MPQEGLITRSTVPFYHENRISLAACVFAILVLACAVFEALDNVLYTQWLRAHIHWFTPVLPAVLLLAAVKHKESKVLIVVTALLILFHYGVLFAAHELGRAGAAVWKLL